MLNQKNINNVDKEVLRMLRLSSYKEKKESNSNSKKIIKEDFIDDLNDAFDSDVNFDELKTDGTKAVLTPEMKLAMVSLSINEYEKSLLDLYGEYNPRSFTTKIPGASRHSDDSTLYSKNPDYKRIQGADSDIKRFKSTQSKSLVHKKGKKFDKEIENFDKTVRIASVFIDPNITPEEIKKMTKRQQGTLMKFWGTKMTDMISYNGKTLTSLGKAQIEFLARAATLQPGDDFESKLFNLTSKSVFRENARKVLWEFYEGASIPIINNLLHKAKINKDNQTREWIEAGLDKVMETMDSKYDHNRSNFGAWALQVIKNTVINKLREVSVHKLLDTQELYNYLFNSPLPLKIQSTADPNETKGHWDRYIIVKDKSNNSKKVYEYIYEDPQNAYLDLTQDARGGGDVSPLSPRYLAGISKARLMKAVHPATLKKPTNSFFDDDSENSNQAEAFKLETLPQDAKSTIYEILNQIADVIISDVGKKYATKDARGNKLYQRMDTETGDADYGYISKNVVPLLKDNKQTFINLMYDLLGFGDIVQVYTKTWEMKNSDGGITKRGIGSPVVYETDSSGNKIPKRNIKGELPGDEDTTTVWSSGSLGEEEVKSNFLEKFIAKSQEEDGGKNEILQILKSNPKEANALISSVRNGLRKFFGFEGLNVPVLRKNRNKLNTIINNYQLSMLAESKARLMIKKTILNYINIK